MKHPSNKINSDGYFLNPLNCNKGVQYRKKLSPLKTYQIIIENYDQNMILFDFETKF